MLEWLMLLGGGLLGSAHCVGMCGPFVVSIGLAAPSPRANLVRQSLHAAGRIFTYVWLGLFAGIAGQWLTWRTVALVRTQAVLSCVAGAVLIGLALKSIGWWPRWRRRRDEGRCDWAAGLAGLAQARGTGEAFLAGMATGFVPCGLVYGYLAMATASANGPRGAAAMAALGLGTVPALVATGCGVPFISPGARRRLRVAGVGCLLLAGQLTMARGLFALASTNHEDSVVCPVHSLAIEDKNPVTTERGLR